MDVNRAIAHVLRERMSPGNEEENLYNEVADSDDDTEDERDSNDGEGKDEGNKRRIYVSEGDEDINQPGPSKRHRNDEKDTSSEKDKTDSDESKKDKPKGDQNDNGQDSDDDDDNGAPKKRDDRRGCQVSVNALLPDRNVYLLRNQNLDPREYPWRIQARRRRERNSAQNGETSSRNGESSSGNAETSSRSGESSSRNCENSSRSGESSSRSAESSSRNGKIGEKSTQNGEHSAQNQPSTSRNASSLSQNEPASSNNNVRISTSGNLPYMTFSSCTVGLRGAQPVVVHCSEIRPTEFLERREREREEPPVPQDRREGEREEPPVRQERQVPNESRQHILYVNLGSPRLANAYRLVDDRNDPLEPILVGHAHIEPAVLISDTAIRRFGRADGEDIVVHIGLNGPYAGHRANIGGRPNRSALRILSVTGYRRITDRSLIHLATAAPHLQRIDFSRTNVSERGVENFRSIRPECEVVFSNFGDSDEGQNT